MAHTSLLSNLNYFRLDSMDMATVYSQSEMDELTDERETFRKLLIQRENDIEHLKIAHQKELQELKRQYLKNITNVYGQLKDLKRFFVELQLFVEQQLDGGTLSQMQELDQGFKDLLRLMSRSSSRVEEAEERAVIERKRSERLNWELQNIKGNIRVFCRVRPFMHFDGDERQKAVHLTESENVTVVDMENAMRKVYNFDRVYGPDSSQETVFNDVKELIKATCDGYNCCSFCYGQAGSGKTHTMLGSPQSPGVMLQALRMIRKEMDETAMQGKVLTAKVGLLEITNDQIYDLIGEQVGDKAKDISKKRQSLDIRHDISGVGVDQLEIPLNDVDRVMDVIVKASQQRAQIHMAASYNSSRGHMLMTVRVEGKGTEGRSFHGKLHLVDLAAFEKHQNHAKTKYGRYINQSLCTLQDVVTALQNKEAHVPYRRSKLTHLLSDSLSGNCKLLMLVTISPLARDLKDTFGTLAFARSARAVELGGVRKEVDSEWNIILKQQKEKLDEADDTIRILKNDNEDMKTQLKRLEKACVDLRDWDANKVKLESERFNLMQQRDMLLKTVRALTQRLVEATTLDDPNYQQPQQPPKSGRGAARTPRAKLLATKTEGDGDFDHHIKQATQVLEAPLKSTDKKYRASPPPSQQQQQLSSSSPFPSGSVAAAAAPKPPAPPAISESEQLWRKRCMELKNMLTQREEKSQAMQMELRLQMMNVKSLVQKCNELSRRLQQQQGNDAGIPELSQVIAGSLPMESPM